MKRNLEAILLGLMYGHTAKNYNFGVPKREER